MKQQKHKSSSHKLTPKNILISILIIALWWVFWLGSQALFMIDVPFISDWIAASDDQSIYIRLTIWIVAVHLIALGVWHWSKRDYSFLKIKDKWDISVYAVPLVLAIVLLATVPTAFGVTMWVYIIVMIITNFAQDLLTTGYMQTGLSKTLGPIGAAIITCVVFYLGHFMIVDTLTIGGSIMVVGFILFSWLRYKRGNIYFVNAIHLTWSLVMILISPTLSV